MSALPRTSPEAVGISSQQLLRLIDRAEAIGLDLHSLMVLRHGQIACEGWWKPYGPDEVHLLYSLSKSFTSTAMGLAVAEGRLTVNDKVLSFFPEDAPEDPSENLRAMRVRDLLTMSAGQGADELWELYCAPDGNWIRAFLTRPVPHEPGSRFMYNSGATYALSAIITKLTGESTLDYLRPRLFDPLGIENATWEADPRGISVGGWGLSVTTESIARFGQLYLKNGKWEGRQILTEEWINEATKAQIANSNNGDPDWCQGYGYQFWRSQGAAYRGDGAFGQFCVVAPDKDMVVAITASVGHMQPVLDLVWDLTGSIESDSLPADDEARARLQKRLANLVAAYPKGESSSPIADIASQYTFRSETGATLRAEFRDDSVKLFFALAPDREPPKPLEVGLSEWKPDVTSLSGTPMRVASWGAWTDPKTFTAEIRSIEAPSIGTFIIHFDEANPHAKLTSRFHFGNQNPLEMKGIRP